MVTIRRYILLTQAELDKSLLEAEGIPSFIPDENSAAVGYANVLGSIRLQVSDEDTGRAQQILGEERDATPLPDDFIPPPEEPPPAEPTQTPAPETDAVATFMWGGIAGLSVFFALAIVAFLLGGIVFTTIGGILLLFVFGGMVGLILDAFFPKGTKNGRRE